MKSQFNGKKVTIMGLGLHGGGAGVAKFFCEQGADVLVTDLKTKEQLEKSLEKLKPFTFRGRKVKGKKLPIKFVLGEHRNQDFINADLIIKNPAVPRESPYLKIARDNKVPIKTDIDIFFGLCGAQIIGVTGSKGKSTTATLIYNLLKSQFKDVILAGNIGVSPLESFDKITKESKVVLELSSFELEDLKKSPHIAVVTNILADHLNRYKSFEEYVESKKSIFKYQGPNDFLVLNYDNPETREFGKNVLSQVYFFSNNKNSNGCYVKDSKVFFGEKSLFDIRKSKLPGEHNVSNLLAAVTVAKILKISNKNIEKTITTFKGISSRQEIIAEIKGVKYINDTTATMPDAAIQAIKTTKERFPDSKIILIVGGQDKGLEYRELAEEIKNKINKIILLPGTASEKLLKELKTIGSNIAIIPVSSMREAVKKAKEVSKSNDIVLLSPAAASFNLFKNEFDRGDQFVAEVKKIT
jgi:UDP-N-acetylmuramoylalanine--D-glutamate ligase